MEQTSCESSASALEAKSIDERMMRSIQQNYQVGHQEEFLKLRIQTEALLMELLQVAGHRSGKAEFTR